jgi:eukaryotic translation initiation factor 2C
MMQAYQHMGQGKPPKITVIIAQKNHHTKLFQADAPDNVPPGMSSVKQSRAPSPLKIRDKSEELIWILVVLTGTVVDSGIVHPKQYDFYMCAHAGPIVSHLVGILDYWNCIT